ncbi:MULTISPECIES: hypothetical protein [unclassified Cytobacillus]|uniref:hypothetical protein n=2 Tax=Cytobacillus TaxID=2675230 RepID=UPI00135B4340|nr:hypothetical protein [Cytobacillus sp. AMY 15.2]KAF0817735.1 hypothetical protein KIS4809_3553 [Bacillus sp. ZZV12-4809]MCM3093710.1 hypothetical protein [Cytobacillus sp. AMY 15.2]
MGVSLKKVCVHNGHVFEIPKKDYSEIRRPEFAKQDILMMDMACETKNRKPIRILRIVFDTLAFDDNGVYRTQDAILTDEFYVQFSYAMYNSNIDERPLPLPRAPINPSKDDINVLKMYITKKYPTISDVFPEWVDYSIKKSKELYQENINKFKVSHKNSLGK